MATYRRGLIPLSADPITFGHIDLVRRALEICEEVVVLVADNDLKAGAYLFSSAERSTMARVALERAGLGSVRVIASSGLVVDAYLREGCDAVIRGVRNAEDEAFERGQVACHEYVFPGIGDRFVFLGADDRFRLVSSSLAKAFVRRGVDVSDFVPAFVRRALEERILGQYKVGITGTQASGKTHVSHRLAEQLRRDGFSAHVVSLDDLIRRLYVEDSIGAQEVRDRIAVLFGNDTLSADRTSVCNAVLKTRLFDPACDAAKRQALHEVVAPHVGRLYREELSGKRGLVLVEWAQMAEMGMSHWTNHNVIVVESSDKKECEAARGIDAEASDRVARFQWSAETKASAIYARAISDGTGTVLRYRNRFSLDGADFADIARLAAAVEEIFPEFPRERGGA